MTNNEKFWKEISEINAHAEYVKEQARRLIEELAEIDRQDRIRRVNNRIKRYL